MPFLSQPSVFRRLYPEVRQGGKVYVWGQWGCYIGLMFLTVQVPAVVCWFVIVAQEDAKAAAEKRLLEKKAANSAKSWLTQCLSKDLTFYFCQLSVRSIKRLNTERCFVSYSPAAALLLCMWLVLRQFARFYVDPGMSNLC